MTTATVDILIPTYRRPAALAVTLTGLAAQEFRDARVVVSDQTENGDPTDSGEVRAVLGVLKARGVAAEVHKHLPRRGMAEHRQYLLDQATAPYALFLDDDVILEPDVVSRLLRAIRQQGCGFVGCAVIGPGFLDDVRPHEQAIEFWDGPVRPEEVRPGTPQWDRYSLHNAANLYHVQRQLGLTGQTQRVYKVAWVGGCVLYDAAKLREVGGFSFWRDLPPEHCGEEVLAQQRLMARHGAELARQGIHLHFYGDFTHGQWRAWIEKSRGLAPDHLHLHANVDQDRWVSEFSRYDAGWLHFFRSENQGDLRRANWDDLNYPARIATLVAAGLPLLQGDNRGSIVATQTLARRLDLGLFISDIEELGAQLRDGARMAQLRDSVWRQRHSFTFDHHADHLVEFFRRIVAGGGYRSRTRPRARRRFPFRKEPCSNERCLVWVAGVSSSRPRPRRGVTSPDPTGVWKTRPQFPGAAAD